MSEREQLREAVRDALIAAGDELLRAHVERKPERADYVVLWSEGSLVDGNPDPRPMCAGDAADVVMRVLDQV